ncbi:cupin domain-containing protein [Paenibacillus tengchongensis]|uniref:cupin domain-containing protein n=1 Tax=Paenibacillus tengchongensis TaxID=2608684 RepID=UPI00124C9B3E|nr:cupin domain-containing protein [Paenibacillus tengchongensis]
MDKKTVQEAVEYREERLTKKILFQKGDSVAFVLNLVPGQELPAHQHPGSDVYILCLKGNGTIQVNDAEEAFSEGEVIHVAGDERFSYRNSGEEPASLYVVLAKIPSPEYAREV